MLRTMGTFKQSVTPQMHSEQEVQYALLLFFDGCFGSYSKNKNYPDVLWHEPSPPKQ